MLNLLPDVSVFSVLTVYMFILIKTKKKPKRQGCAEIKKQPKSAETLPAKTIEKSRNSKSVFGFSPIEDGGIDNGPTFPENPEDEQFDIL